MNKTESQYLRPDQLVDRWGGCVTVKTLANWRQQGIGPTPTKLGGRVVYHVEDVREYESHKRRSA